MLSKHRNLVLVGFMGTGKTVVGRLLAARLRRGFVEMDERIATRAGKTISDIFEQDGEPAFRRMERDLVVELAADPGRVISAGGGAILDSRNLEDFNRTGEVVCLTATPEILMERLRTDRSRPLLQGDREGRIRELLKVRLPLYEAIPLRIDTAGRSPEAVAEEVMRLTCDFQ
ncbi:MAG: shikimate kinase [Kiritimatiellia bacterium]|nr:shikimate kinase [Kiritimatiellia bacterium]